MKKENQSEDLEWIYAYLKDIPKELVDLKIKNIGDIGPPPVTNLVPDDHCNQINSEYYIDKIYSISNPKEILDLGCGMGDSIDYFRKKDSNVKYTGLDIGSSPEVNSRTRKDVVFQTYDGINIPFEDEKFDLIYSKCVFEHVEKPHLLIKEIDRVLKKGGYFIGEIAQIEPFHSLSVISGFTPYGLYKLVDDTNLKLIEIRPGIDGFTLMLRRLLGRPEYFSQFFYKESPTNKFFNKFKEKLTNKQINSMKLLFGGHICFMIQKK